jgi:hypothetical protein
MRIGFSGHRPNRLHVGVERIRARLMEALKLLSQEAPTKNAGAPLTAVSPLAEGSDRIFAEAVLEHGMTLEALLPMSIADYIQTFEDQTTTPAFHALLARASAVTELPGSLADSKAAYEALGHAMVDACDVLVTVWDGKAAAGRGGTPEVIEYALSKGRRVIWVDAGSDNAAVQLKAISPRIEVAPWVA